jgi:hypothetical protein
MFTEYHTTHNHFQAMKRALFIKINQIISFTNSKCTLSLIRKVIWQFKRLFWIHELPQLALIIFINSQLLGHRVSFYSQ